MLGVGLRGLHHPCGRRVLIVLRGHSGPRHRPHVAAVVDDEVLSVPSSVVGINDDRVVLTVIQVVDGVGYHGITNQTSSTSTGYAAT